MRQTKGSTSDVSGVVIQSNRQTKDSTSGIYGGDDTIKLFNPTCLLCKQYNESKHKTNLIEAWMQFFNKTCMQISF